MSLTPDAPRRIAVIRLYMVFAICLVSVLPVAKSWGQLDLPPIPTDSKFVQDYAGVISSAAVREMAGVQKEAFEAHYTPIVVVTIVNMSQYGADGYSIESFARELFDDWQIARTGDDGELVNRGILVLVSVGDRSARIELGADWGRSWDDHCARIMDRRMVPRFAKGDYSSGIVAGVEALGEMAAMGTDATPPRGLADWIERFDEKPFETSPLPLWGVLAMVVGGIVLIGISVTGWPGPLLEADQAGWFLVAGILLILGAFLFWIVLIGLAVILRTSFFGDESSGGGFSGGFGSSGGFGGGGFSGGGGASGSW